MLRAITSSILIPDVATRTQSKVLHKDARRIVGQIAIDTLEQVFATYHNCILHQMVGMSGSNVATMKTQI
jgi:hypothetical protein